MAFATATQLLTLKDVGGLLTTNETIGIANLPDQVVRDFSGRENGYCFNLMVLGETCSGKSTLVESLFGESFEDADQNTGHGHPSVRISSKRKIIEEGSVKVNVSVTVCSGLGDQLDKGQSASPAVDHIEALFAAELEEELKSDRDYTRVDKLVHACIYLLAPTGREMKELDIHMMQQLHKRVHVIPVIGKADSITRDELEVFKKSVAITLQQSGIETYNPFSLDAEEKYTKSFPLAVVASTEVITVDGAPKRVRQYPWGEVDVENPEHSNLALLRNVILRDETYYMVKTTKEYMYGQYREQQLTKMGFVDFDSGGNRVGLLENLAAKKQETLGESNRREKELRQRFLAKANEESARIQHAKAELTAKFDQLKAIHKKEQTELQRQNQMLTNNRAAWRMQIEAEQAAERNQVSSRKGRSRLGSTFKGKKKEGSPA